MSEVATYCGASYCSSGSSSASSASSGGGPQLLVFVLEVPSPASGGYLQFDQQCGAAAAARSKSGTFLSWTSDMSSSPDQRFSQSASDYVLVDGTVVAQGWGGVTGFGLLAPIDLDLSGNVITSVQVWTGTGAAGAAHSATCNNWTSATASYSGQTGSTMVTGIGWTNNSSVGCDAASPSYIYCFQQ